MVTGDSWYGCAKNLKAIRNYGLGFMFAIKSNRILSIDKGSWQQVQTLDIPDHPKTGDYLKNLALLLKIKGEYALSLETYRRALTITLYSLVTDHPRDHPRV